MNLFNQIGDYFTTGDNVWMIVAGIFVLAVIVLVVVFPRKQGMSQVTDNSMNAVTPVRTRAGIRLITTGIGFLVMSGITVYYIIKNSTSATALSSVLPGFTQQLEWFAGGFAVVGLLSLLAGFMMLNKIHNYVSTTIPS